MTRPVVLNTLTQPSGQTVDGSLTFERASDTDNTYLERTSTAGNSKKWTWSGWIKLDKIGNTMRFFGGNGGSSGNADWLSAMIADTGVFRIGAYGLFPRQSNEYFRDATGWYHFCIAVDIDANTDNKYRVWANGQELTWASKADQSNTGLNRNGYVHYIGAEIQGAGGSQNNGFGGKMAQVNFIDGMALGPEYFGFRDPLTNSWRPHKFEAKGTTVNNGTDWSSNYSGTAQPTQAFTGNGPVQDGYAHQSGSLTLTFPSPGLTGRIIVYGGTGGGGADTYTLSDGSSLSSDQIYTTAPYYEPLDFGEKKNITSLVCSAGYTLYAISVDGVFLKDSTTETLSFGTNGYYLPMDGNSPIGEDKSGNGNDFTPNSKFRNTNSVDKATGALPILEGAGGAVANVGVRTDRFANSPNDGTTWSSNSVSITGGSISNAADGFNGSIASSGYAELVATDTSTTANVTFTASIPNVTKVEVFVHSASSSGDTRGTCLDTDGVTHTSATLTSASQSFHTIYEGPPITLANVGWGINQNGQTGTGSDGFRAFRVNGYILKDSTSSGEGLVLALPLVGNKEDVVASINSAQTNVTVTNNGSVPFNSTQSNFYGGSAFFEDSSSDNLTFTNFGSRFEFTGDYTIEAWIYPTDSGAADGSIFVENSGSNYFSFNFDPGTQFNIYNNSSSPSWSPSTNLPPANKWSHIALVRSGSTQTIYVNGNSIATNTASGTHGYASPSFARIGGGASSGLDSYIQDVRIYKGVAKYTSNFIPASTSPDILPDTPSGVSGGSKLTKITDGAVSFDATGDYLSMADSSDFAFGTGDFTAECFIYPKGNASYRAIIDCRDQVSDPNGWILGVDANDQIYIYTTGFLLSSGNGVTGENKWYHVAYVRNSGTHKLYVDGREVATSSTSLDYTTDNCVIGASYAKNSEYWNGFISNVRLVKGTALYTANFTPPTRELTNVTNTKLLCCQSNSEGPQKTAVIPSVTGTATAMWPLDSDINDDSGNSNNLSENGGSTGFTSAGTNPFGLSNCADFPADGKYLSYAVTPASAWTIDGYIKFDDVSSGSNSYVLGWNGTNGSDTTIGLTKSNSTFTVWGSSNLSTTTVAEAGRWYHVRLTTNGTTDLALYVDGVLAGRSTSSDGSPASPITIGDMQSGRFNGQIAGVRYTPTDLGAPPLGGETTSSGVTSNSPSAGIGLAGDVAATNFNPFNTDINTVRGQETGYPTINLLYANPNGTGTLSNGNLTHTTAAGNGQYNATLSIKPKTGKFYWEVTKQTSSNVGMIGITDMELALPGYNANNVGSFSWYIAGPRKQTANVDTNYGSSVSENDVVGVAYDSDARELRFYLNGVDQGVAFDSSSIGEAEYFPAFSAGSSTTAFTYTVNFGQTPFKFSPPDGYQSLNLANTRPERVITNPTQYIGITTYKGTGSAQFLSLGFEPDLMWSKTTSQSVDHKLVDSVRGLSKVQEPNQSRADSTASTGITATNPGGFSVGSSGDFNTNGRRYVTWCWKAGGSKGTFNVDDVDVGSAANAQMNVGGQNSNAFNQSQTWSSNSASDSRAFDGSLAYDSNATRLYGTSTYHKILDSTTYFTDVNSLRVGTSENPGNSQLKIDGAIHPTTYISGVGLTVTNPPAKFKQIEILGAGTGVQISYIMINGVVLVDNGATPSVNVPSIASDKCSVGTKNGFSIVQYEGNGTTNQSLAHGLSQAPDFVIIKNMSEAYSWAIWHRSLSLNGGSAHNSPEYDMLSFDTSGETDFSEDCIWDVFDHSLRVHRSGSGNWVNKDTNNFIMYSWHNVPGLQKFGKYVGNGNNSGPFIELGFRPALIITKRIGADGNNWQLIDSVRSPYNPANWVLKPDEAGQETTSSDYDTDFLSNGFKHRTSHAARNADGSEYVYMAWAEEAASGLYGSISNAR